MTEARLDEAVSRLRDLEEAVEAQEASSRETVEAQKASSRETVETVEAQKASSRETVETVEAQKASSRETVETVEAERHRRVDVTNQQRDRERRFLDEVDLIVSKTAAALRYREEAQRIVNVNKTERRWRKFADTLADAVGLPAEWRQLCRPDLEEALSKAWKAKVRVVMADKWIGTPVHGEAREAHTALNQAKQLFRDAVMKRCHGR